MSALAEKAGGKSEVRYSVEIEGRGVGIGAPDLNGTKQDPSGDADENCSSDPCRPLLGQQDKPEQNGGRRNQG
jgi:hypothetical protein